MKTTEPSDECSPAHAKTHKNTQLLATAAINTAIMVTFAAVLHSETPAGGGRGGQLASTKKQVVQTDLWLHEMYSIYVHIYIYM